MKPSATAYDDSFRTLLTDCSELIIPVVNETFHENYTGQEKVILEPNEQLLPKDDNVEKVITDAVFCIVKNDNAKKRYHIECESSRLDKTILVRVFEYDTRIAFKTGEMDEHTFTVSIPHSAVLALRHTDKTPDAMRIRVITPGGETGYAVPIVKVQKYSLDDIFDRKLFFFLPFHIFNYEKELPEYENNEEKLSKLTDEYRDILARLNTLQKAGEMSGFTKEAICAMINHVMALIAANYEKVREEVNIIMSGQVVDYEAKRIRNEGISIGRNEGISIGFDRGRNEGINIGRDEERKLATAETEARAKDMLRDRMDISLVEKYTHLSMSRIQELAHGLGML